MLGLADRALGSRAPAKSLALERQKALRVNALSIWLLLAAFFAIYPIEPASGQTMNENSICATPRGKMVTEKCVVKWFFDEPPGEQDNFNLPDGAANVSIVRVQIIGNVKMLDQRIGGTIVVGADIRIVESASAAINIGSIHSASLRRPRAIKTPDGDIIYDGIEFAPFDIDEAVKRASYYHIILYTNTNKTNIESRSWVINYLLFKHQ